MASPRAAHMSQEMIPAPPELNPQGSIDFQALHAKAMAHTAGDTPQAPVAVVTPPVAAPSQVAAPEAVVAQSESPANPQVIDLPDDALVKVKVDGVEQLVPFKDYRDGVQREAAFTKRMQTLADQRREADAVFTRREAELLQKAQAIEAAQRMLAPAQTPLEQLLKQLQAPTATPAPDPGEIATLGEVQQAIEALKSQFQDQTVQQQAEFAATLHQSAQAMREQQQLEADATRFTQALDGIFSGEATKLLKETVPFAEEALRFQVSKLDPSSIEEAISFAESIANEWTTKLNASNAQALKQSEIARARHKMEPSVGTPPPLGAQSQRPTFLRKTGGLDWDAMRQRAASLLE